MNRTSTVILLFALLFSSIGFCQSSKDSIQVYYFSNSDLLKTYESLDLDASHANLLNPQESKEEINAVIASWSDLHQRIGKYLAEKDFKWGSEDENVGILQKIYFDKTGNITHYFFRVFNEDVTEEKKEEFADHLRAFAKSNTISIKRDQQFAQCGKTRYAN